MPLSQSVLTLCRAARRSVILSFTLLAGTLMLFAQSRTPNPFYARTNTFGFFASYSNDSSHILLGDAANRKLLNFGVSYSRKLLMNRAVDWQYDAEFMPVALESDPVQIVDFTYTIDNPPAVYTERLAQPPVGPCIASSGSGSVPGVYSFTYAATCQRRWTVGQAMSPFGLRWNFRPRHRLQPFLDGHGGFMYSTQPIPVSDGGSFNFLFDIGAGLELYRSRAHSLRVEYRYHHISNDDTAPSNPGIDNGLLQFTWAFGR